MNGWRFSSLACGSDAQTAVRRNVTSRPATSTWTFPEKVTPTALIRVIPDTSESAVSTAVEAWPPVAACT
jgi:hypothetical protein